MLAQVQQDQKDLPAAVAAVQNAGTDEGVKNLAAVSTLLHLSVTSKAAAVQTPGVSVSGNNNNNNNKGGNNKQFHNHHVEGVKRWAKRNLVVDDQKL